MQYSLACLRRVPPDERLEMEAATAATVPPSPPPLLGLLPPHLKMAWKRFTSIPIPTMDTSRIRATTWPESVRKMDIEFFWVIFPPS